VPPADGVTVDSAIGDALERRDYRGAFELLARHHGPSVYSLCCRMLRDRVRAEDVMQDALIKGFETIDKLRDPSRLRAWMSRIATRQCLDALRTKKRERRLEELVARDDGDALTEDLLQLLASSQEKQALEQCLASLPADKRAAVLGRFFSELAYEDLSAELQQNGDTIRIRIARALPELRTCLESKGVVL
jgi:RNA polymerase sigma-70 factor (ECF subfamily)